MGIRSIGKKAFMFISPTYRKVDAIQSQLRELNNPPAGVTEAPTVSDAAPPPERVIRTPDPNNTEFWHDYYNMAENDAPEAFVKCIKPVLQRYPTISLVSVLDFACGFGRIANMVKNDAAHITLCDINALAIDFCKERFAKDTTDCTFDYCVSDRSLTLPFKDAQFSFVYSWDAMVHFSYKWLDYYLEEFARILQKGGHALIHHSNYGNVNPEAEKSDNWFDNPHGRTNVTKEDFARIAARHGFNVVEQTLMDWADEAHLDCLTLLSRE